MASQRPVNLLRASLVTSVPLLIDLIYQEAYFVPSTLPNIYTQPRLQELIKPAGFQFARPATLSFAQYHTENRWHIQYVYAKKSFWRYNLMWSFLGCMSSALQILHMVNAVMIRRPFGIFAALGTMGLTWTGIIVEGKARRLFLDEMHDTVVKEEEVWANSG